MKQYNIDQIRNFALCGHNGCGKTMLAEAILHVTGASKRFGKVDEGTTVSDYSEEEIQRKISISASLLHAEYKGTKINVVDLPGSPDLFGETVAALPAVDVALIVVSGTAGIEVITEQSYRYCEKYGVPRAFAVNKIDKEHVEFQPVVDKIQEVFGHAAVPVQIPIGEAMTFKGVIDLVSQKAYSFDDKGKATPVDMPADQADAVSSAREKLIENIAESDDSLLEKFFDSGELTEEEIIKGMKQAIQSGNIMPIFVTSATSAAGISTMLDFAVSYFPSPADKTEIKGIDPRTSEEKARPVSPAGAPTGYVFKTISEAHVGELAFVRAFSGAFNHGDELQNMSTGSSEKIGQIYATNGKERTEIDSLRAGDIAALVKLKDTHTGDVLTSKSDPFAFPPPDYPTPVIDLGIKGTEKGDEEKISAGLSKLREEDPTFEVKADPELRQTLIIAQGELQVDILVKKLKERYGVDVELVKPKIPYRETILGKAEVQYRYKKQSGGRGQFGEVHIRMAPVQRGVGFEFVDSITGGVIPSKFIPSVEKGVKEAMQNGGLAGYPVIDIQVELFYGKTHAVDSSDQAFKMAGLFAFRDAFDKCNPVMLEPIYDIEVRVPDEFTGDVAGDISSRRGRIAGMTPEKGQTIVKAQVPQAELYKYSTQLKSLTQGRGFYTRDFSHYEEVPRDIQEKLVAEHQAARAAEK